MRLKTNIIYEPCQLTSTKCSEMKSVAPRPRSSTCVGFNLKGVVSVHVQSYKVHKCVCAVEIFLTDRVRQLVIRDLVHDNVTITEITGWQVPGQANRRLCKACSCEILWWTRGR